MTGENDMAIEKLIWVGLACCLTALGMQVFPNAAFSVGIDVNSAWLVFGFGIFLILISAFVALTGGGSRACDGHEHQRRS